MAVKYTVESLEGIDEALKQFYVEKDGKFTFDIEGVKPTQEFDTVYSTLQKERKEKKDIEKSIKAFGEHTPETIAELIQKNEELKVLSESNENNSEEINKKIEGIRSNYEAKLDLAKENTTKSLMEKDNLIAELQQTILDGRKKEAILSEVKKFAKPEALDDVMSLMMKMIDYNEELEQFEEVDTGLNIKESAEKFFKERDYLVMPSTSGGATGGSSKRTVKNPFTEENWSKTEQAKLFLENPALCEKYRKEAGA